MNTIKDLAIKWWLNLKEQECHNFRIKYPDFNIEDIFYQEVILKWYVGKYGKVEFDYNEQQIKEIYLKEHTKEQPLKGDVLEEELWNTPQSVDNTIDVEEMNYQSSNLVTEKKEAIEFADYLLGNFEMAEFEKEHPKYVVDDELCWQLAGTKQKYTTVEMYQIYLNDTNKSQPKAIEDNVLEEARKEYFKYVSECRLNGVTYLDFFKWLEKHYSLIKK